MAAIARRWNPALALMPELDPHWLMGIPVVEGLALGCASGGKGVDRRMSRSSWLKILRRDKICSLCGRRVGRRGMTLDHVEPLSTGGRKSAVFNGAGACRDCNGRRGNTPILLFLLFGGAPQAVAA